MPFYGALRHTGRLPMAAPNRLQRTSGQRLIYLAVAALLFIQVGWWLSIQIRESRRLEEAQIETLKAARAEAWQMDSFLVLPFYYQQDVTPRPGGHGVVIQGTLPTKLPSLAERKAAIEARYPQVAVVPAPVAPDDPHLVDHLDAYLTLRMEPLRQMEQERRLALWRAAGEAIVLAAAILGGFTFIYRKLTEEMDLKLRQRNFTASVTHELKTPIASLRVWMETLFDRELSGEQRVKIRTRMDQDLERLAELVNNLLDVARSESGSMEIRPEPLELGPWLRGVAEAMDQRLGPGSLGLRLNLAPGVWTFADPKALAMVLENLLSNAYKYAEDPRFTTLTLDGHRDEAVIVVGDHGAGIPAKELPRLFQRFYRVGDEMTRAVPGTGLGLFLAREIVQRHGGEIRAASRGRGFGATFTIRLGRIAAPPISGTHEARRA
ncbi:MAG TPA: HAMP domain-containing sensor histidine kinase [Holophagaceae bacterium]|nr:HAMP domain-containing sensor histidine kinase [Holophagaceae bacterium]